MRASSEQRARAQRVLLLAIIAVVLIQFCMIDPNMPHVSNEKVGPRRIDVDEWEKSIIKPEDAPNTTTTTTAASDANGSVRSEGVVVIQNRTQSLEYCGNWYAARAKMYSSVRSKLTSRHSATLARTTTLKRAAIG